MSEAGTAVENPPEARPSAPESGLSRVIELKVSGHLMTLDAGVYCVFQMPAGVPPNDRSGLPGVRLSLPPGPGSRPEAVSISSFRGDGWVGNQDAALVRVANGQAQILVTIYQVPGAPPERAPRLQVTRIGVDSGAEARAQVATAAAGGAIPDDAEVVVHIQRTGDVPARIGDWVGTRGSKSWIEGFSLMPRDGVAAKDIEYQAVLGRGWLSPWIEGGKFCGSRGMALPLLGLKIRLKGAAAKSHECNYSASFVDGSSVGPVQSGETCEAESLAALESFQVVIQRRGAGAEASGAGPREGRARGAPAGSAEATPVRPGRVTRPPIPPRRPR
jgi:hypothetical protein